MSKYQELSLHEGLSGITDTVTDSVLTEITTSSVFCEEGKGGKPPPPRPVEVKEQGEIVSQLCMNESVNEVQQD